MQVVVKIMMCYLQLCADVYDPFYISLFFVVRIGLYDFELNLVQFYFLFIF